MGKQPRLIRLALFGSPVKHSLSPKIHAMFARQAGLDVEYTAIESSADFLSRDIQRLVENSGRGCNITLPLKYRAFELADRTSERARRCGAANTLVFESASHWYADNTDGAGLVRDMPRARRFYEYLESDDFEGYAAADMPARLEAVDLRLQTPRDAGAFRIWPCSVAVEPRRGNRAKPASPYPFSRGPTTRPWKSE